MPYFGLHTGIALTEMGCTCIVGHARVPAEIALNSKALEIPSMKQLRVEYW